MFKKKIQRFRKTNNSNFVDKIFNRNLALQNDTQGTPKTKRKRKITLQELQKKKKD